MGRDHESVDHAAAEQAVDIGLAARVWLVYRLQVVIKARVLLRSRKEITLPDDLMPRTMAGEADIVHPVPVHEARQSEIEAVRAACAVLRHQVRILLHDPGPHPVEAARVRV